MLLESASKVRLTAVLTLLAFGLMLLVGASPASAHESDEGIFAVVDESRAVVTGAVAFEDLGFGDKSGDGLLDNEELATQQQAVARSLVDTAREHVAIKVDGEPVDIIGTGVPYARIDSARSQVNYSLLPSS